MFKTGFSGRLVGALLLACCLSSCASLVGKREVEVSLAKLQQGAERRFPIDHTVLGIFALHLAEPRLALFPGQDRVGLTVQASVAPAFMRRGWGGTLAVSGRLTVDPASGGVFMREATVDRFEVEGLDEARRQQFARAATQGAQQWLAQMPLYQFHADDLRVAGVQMQPTRIRTGSDRIVVSFEPAPAVQAGGPP